MPQKKVHIAILGSTGMLAGMLLHYFSKNSNVALTATYYRQGDEQALKKFFPAVAFEHFDAAIHRADELHRIVKGAEWIVNAIGMVKFYIDKKDFRSIERTILINSLLPHCIAEVAEARGIRAIHPSTDCLFSGARGRYLESDEQDATDIYGKSKSLGEAHSAHVQILRCSIIGPEMRTKRSLLEWFLGHSEGSTVPGFTQHLWNGVTSLHWAKLVESIILRDKFKPGVQHIVPGDSMSKAELLELFARAYRRGDLRIAKSAKHDKVDRTLATENESYNRELWRVAGYQSSPTLEEMIREVALVNLGTI